MTSTIWVVCPCLKSLLLPFCTVQGNLFSRFNRFSGFSSAKYKNMQLKSLQLFLHLNENLNEKMQSHDFDDGSL